VKSLRRLDKCQLRARNSNRGAAGKGTALGHKDTAGSRGWGPLHFSASFGETQLIAGRILEPRHAQDFARSIAFQLSGDQSSERFSVHS
jgi:hypothetical protein